MKSIKTLESLKEKTFAISELNAESILKINGGWETVTTKKTVTQWEYCGGCWTKVTRTISEIKSAD